MPKYIGNYVGFSTFLEDDAGSGNKGVWNLIDQFFFKRKDEWVKIPISATGGTISTPGNGYTYHLFSSPGNFVISAGEGFIDVLIVAGGGGGGGGYYTGGAGAGGVVYGNSIDVATGTYPIIVGSGGAGSPGASGTSGDGLPSSFNSVTAIGGGGGGSGPGNPDGGREGGSSGGSDYYTFPGITAVTPQPVPASYTAYGNSGGASRGEPGDAIVGGGGGGAGGPGAAPPNIKGGVGQPFTGFEGPLIPTLSPVVPLMGPTNNYYGGGGSGGSPVNVPGGFGGGGTGVGPGPIGGAGGQYLGGGAGGKFGAPPGGGAGGNGGSGTVIIRYLP
jgi:hypothetical protein